jgi:hypothetical protein
MSSWFWHLQLARDFVKSVTTTKLEPIDGSEGMFVMRDVVSLETGSKSDVVIRSVTPPFWQACMDEVEAGCRVCAFGNSGIGKTACTPYLIKMLLEAKKVVVYHVRTNSKDGWIYEFVPGLADDDSVATSVYPEQTQLSGIVLLNSPKTYYVVDPGDTTDSCSPPATFRPKVIIVAAPDARHWGGDTFLQRRGAVHGKLKVFPLWELDELLQARPVLGSTLSDEDVTRRYHQVGGVPRHIFESYEAFQEVLESQMAAFSVLTSHEVKRLAYLHVKSPATFDDPRQVVQNAAAGFYVSDADDGTFSRYAIDAVAPSLVGKVLEVYAGTVWKTLVKFDAAHDPWFFEAHARYLLAEEEGQARSFRGTCSYGQAKKRSWLDLPLGGCTEMRSAHDIVAAARDRPMVLFHPVPSATAATARDRLSRRCVVDFMYRDHQGHYFAFRAVAAGGQLHVHGDPLQELADAVGGKDRLTVVYMVPDATRSGCEPKLVMDRGQAWRPAPIEGDEETEEGEEEEEPMSPCNVYHVTVSNPNRHYTDVESCSRYRRRRPFVFLTSRD